MKATHLLMAGMLIVVGFGCDLKSASFVFSETCEDLSPHIIELSKEKNTGILNISILKMYDIKESSSEGTNRLLNCLAVALFDSGGRMRVNFYMLQDEDGDYFYGYDPL